MDVRQKGAEALVAGLKRWGVDRVFGLPGVHLDPFFDALFGAQDEISVIHTRHEQGAAYMALGAAMSTGKPSVFAVVPGPGLLNAGAALATAYACNAPVLCITTTVVAPLLDRNYGALHELRDQTSVLRGLVHWHGLARHASEVPQLVEQAFHEMLSGRPRPVVLEMPPEVLAQTALMPSIVTAPAISNPKPDVDQVTEASRLIMAAKAPAIIVGGGAQGAGDEVKALAELIGAPVISRQMGRGVLSDAHPLSIQAVAANDIWPEFDLAIAVGTRFQHLREWGFDKDLRVIRIDLDPSELAKIRAPEVGMVADAGEALSALTKSLGDAGFEQRQCSIDLDGARKTARKRMAEDIPRQLEYIAVIRDELPDDGVVVDEITQVGHVTKLAMPVLAPRTLITSGYQGTLGYGFATALGAQAATGRRVLSINGDGGFMYTMPELATAVLHKIPIVAIVFNDKCYGNVQAIQRRWYNDHVIATDLHNPEFAKMATCFGALGLFVTSPEALRGALKEAFAQDLPALIEVEVGPEEMGWPWGLIIPKKMRGI